MYYGYFTFLGKYIYSFIHSSTLNTNHFFKIYFSMKMGKLNRFKNKNHELYGIIMLIIFMYQKTSPIHMKPIHRPSDRTHTCTTILSGSSGKSAWRLHYLRQPQACMGWEHFICVSCYACMARAVGWRTRQLGILDLGLRECSEQVNTVRGLPLLKT